MAPYVVDIQCFSTLDVKTPARWTVKELAIYDGTVSYHYIFKPPFPFHWLSPALKSEAYWNMKYYHGIPWGEGTEPPQDLRGILRAATRNADVIYVKGERKAALLREYVEKPVVEFPDHPKLRGMFPECPYHKLAHRACALANVYTLYKFYLYGK